MIPTGDDFERQMRKVVRADDLELWEYIRKIADLPALSMDEGSIPLKTESYWLAHSLPTGFGLSESEYSEADKIFLLFHLKEVVSTAVKYLDRGVSFKELIAAGNGGLIVALQSDRPERSMTFSSSAFWCIRNSIQQTLLARARREQRLKPMTPKELDSEDREAIEQNNTCEEQLSASSVTQELLREDIVEVMAGLSPRERDVLRLRFGLDDGKQQTLEEVAGLLGITRDRVRQIEAAALRKLCHPHRSRRSTPPPPIAPKRNPNHKFRDALEHLPLDHATILRFKWGFADGRIYSAKEVAKKFNMSIDEVDKIERKALTHDSGI